MSILSLNIKGKGEKIVLFWVKFTITTSRIISCMFLVNSDNNIFEVTKPRPHFDLRSMVAMDAAVVCLLIGRSCALDCPHRTWGGG